MFAYRHLLSTEGTPPTSSLPRGSVVADLTNIFDFLFQGKRVSRAYVAWHSVDAYSRSNSIGVDATRSPGATWLRDPLRQSLAGTPGQKSKNGSRH